MQSGRLIKETRVLFRKCRAGFYTICVLLSCGPVQAQTISPGVPPGFTLEQCVDYALKNQALVKQARIDEDINREDIGMSLSGWLPQLNLDANIQHYLKLPTAFYPNLADPTGPKIETTSGLVNTSAAQFTANQALYSTDLVFSGKVVRDLKLRARENTAISEINTIVDVSRSFYDAMLTIEQVELWEEEITRLERNYQDAYHLYQNGLTDKIDYQQALISVNNAKAQKRTAEEAIRTKNAILKQAMGYPPQQPLNISFDSAAYEDEIKTDTLEILQYSNRIEYQQMETNLQLQNAEVGYYRWSFLPSVSAFYNYNLNFENNSLAPLYNSSFPNSLIGLKLTLPIFQGTNRLQHLQKAHLQYQRMQLDQQYLESQISSEYTQALSDYKSNLYALGVSKENITIAQEVYNTVSMQYAQGVKSYLDVIVAETGLRSAKLNYLSTLFQVLSSKLDLQAALGDIPVK